jgi:hypothetical protein
MSYTTRSEREKYPQTLMFIEEEGGSLEFGPDFWLRATTEDGTHSRRLPPRLRVRRDRANHRAFMKEMTGTSHEMRRARSECCEGSACRGDEGAKAVSFLENACKSARTGEVARVK